MKWYNCNYSGGGDTKDKTASFVHNRTRENIKSGEKHSTIFGKIARYFEDLKLVAFTGSYDDLNGKPTAMPPTAHTHTKSQISDFPSTMAPTAHMHSLTDIIFDNNNLSFKKWDNQAEIWYKGNMMLMFANYSPDNLEILNDGGTGDLGRHFLINQTLSVLGLTIHSTYVNRAFLTAKYHSICI